MELIFQGQRLELMAERAVFWLEQQAILVADLHWGKDATFRAHGIPVSRGQLEDELQRLIDLCQQVSARQLFVLGKNLEKNSFFNDEANTEEDFEFNQDFEVEEGTRSPGWIRYQKRIK